MSLRVVKSGMLDSIQDLGRFGYSHWGINPSGAMDQYAAQIANALVGNKLSDATIEIHFPALILEFTEDHLIALAGAEFSTTINGKPIPAWKPIMVAKGSILKFEKRLSGTRMYFAVHGGLDITQWLGSRSTNLKASAGGFHGRALKKGDELQVCKGKYSALQTDGECKVLRWGATSNSVYRDNEIIFFIRSREWDWLTDESKKLVEEMMFTIDSSSDRMAYTLQHEKLAFNFFEELLSTGVMFGTIQLLPSGKLIVLMADHQTTGGYARIGQIVTAHLPKLSQAVHHHKFRLQNISLEQAEKMLFSLQQDVQLVQQSCKQKLDEYYASH